MFARGMTQCAVRALASHIVGALALMLLFGFVERRWGFHGFPRLIALGSPLPLLFNRLLCLYVLALTRPLERFERRWLVHGLPFLALLAYMIQGFSFGSPSSCKRRGTGQGQCWLGHKVRPVAHGKLVGLACPRTLPITARHEL